MNKKTSLPERAVRNNKQKSKVPLTPGTNYPLIQKAVLRAVREYGETLKKLARDD